MQAKQVTGGRQPRQWGDGWARHRLDRPAGGGYACAVGKGGAWRLGRDAETIPARRRARIVEQVRLRGAASVQELAAALNTSASTIRRDLELLESEGHVERTHGGALLQEPTRSSFEPPASLRAWVQFDAKRAIGRAAALRIEARQSVVFDSSSTVRAAAEAVVARNLALTAVTNDLAIAQVLAGSPQIKTVVTGGTVRAGSTTLLGEPGASLLQGLAADIAFVGAHAVSAGGLSDTALDVAATKRALLRAARRVVLLIDATKFRPPAFARIVGLDAVDEVIVDTAAPPDARHMLEDAGCILTVVDVGS